MRLLDRGLLALWACDLKDGDHADVPVPGVIRPIPKDAFKSVNLTRIQGDKKLLHCRIGGTGNEDSAIDVDSRVGELVGGEHPKRGVPMHPGLEAIELGFVSDLAFID